MSYELLDELVNYDPSTGTFTWKNRGSHLFKNNRLQKAFNNRFANKQCFTTKDKFNYLRGTINYKSVLAHRLAWLLVHKEWPELYLDHIDGNGSNNKINNLRLATAQENQRNRKTTLGSSKYKGVYYCNTSKRWVASVTVDYRRVFSSYHKTEEEAVKNYNKVAGDIFGDYFRQD